MPKGADRGQCGARVYNGNQEASEGETETSLAASSA